MTEYFEIEPAKAKAKKPAKLWDNPEWIAEEKLDGWRFLMHFGDELERTYMTGRRTSSITGRLSEKGLCAKPLWVKKAIGYTILDGEVMPPDGSGFRDIASIMNTSELNAAERIAEIGAPRYVAFDILWHDGVDMRESSYLERRSALCDVVDNLNHDLISIVDKSSADESWYDGIVAQGGEGVILKSIFGEYGEDWVKVKAYSTLDVVVTGFTDAKFGRTGKYHGQIGAAIVSVYGSTGNLLEVGQVSGMTDEVRRHMTNNPAEWIGTVIEVAAQGWARNRLRHPRFKRRRPDAHPYSASFAKMQVDLGLIAPIMKVPGQQELF